MNRVALALLLCSPGVAAAYETDQLTDRHLPLDDIEEPANERVDEMLAVAVAETNERTGCEADLDKTRKVLARRIDKATSRGRRVKGRGFLGGFGYSEYSAWIESSELPKRYLDGRDIFSALTVWHSFILATAGANSTVRIAGVLQGSDKTDHFFALGFDYLRWSRWGADPERALRRGTFTERVIYGMLTSKTFSWADLKANYDGFLFYSALLTEQSVLQVGDDGCVAQVDPWDWSDWVTWEYDEVLNPSWYTPPVHRGIARHIDDNRDAYCESFWEWGSPDYLAGTFADVPAYAVGQVPPRRDPFELYAICGWPDEAPETTDAPAP